MSSARPQLQSAMESSHIQEKGSSRYRHLRVRRFFEDEEEDESPHYPIALDGNDCNATEIFGDESRGSSPSALETQSCLHTGMPKESWAYTAGPPGGQIWTFGCDNEVFQAPKDEISVYAARF
jgi:hypothetical protein